MPSLRTSGIALLLPLLFACKGKEYIHKGVVDKVEIAYRWNHPVNKPSELLLKMTNTSEQARTVQLEIDLYYQGRTVETFTADTCMRPGQTMNGKLNGIYFIPSRVDTEQIKSGDTQVEITRSTVTQEFACP